MFGWAMFLCATALLFKLLSLWYKIIYLNQIITVSLTLGILVFMALLVMVAIELKQDEKLNNYYTNNKNFKVKISDTFYECQYCGNQKVKKDEIYCMICGGIFLQNRNEDKVL